MTGAPGDPPGYWMHETSGVLRPAVEAYLAGGAMTSEQIAAMRAYLRQWINSPCWDKNPHATQGDRQQLAMMRRLVDVLTSRATIEAWIAGLTEMGMDPL